MNDLGCCFLIHFRVKQQILLHVFRLYTPKKEEVDDSQFNTEGEYYFGFFERLPEGGFLPEKKAYVYQKICGGTKELR